MSSLSLVPLICLSPLMSPVLFLIFLRCAFEVSVNSSNTHLLGIHLCRQHLYSTPKIKCWRKQTSPCPFRISSVMGKRDFATIITGKTWVVKQRMFPENEVGLSSLSRVAWASLGRWQESWDLKTNKWEVGAKRKSNAGRAFQAEETMHCKP